MTDYVNLNDLKAITTDIKNQADEISNAYTNQVINALESSKNELKVSGVNYEEMQETIKKVFTSVASQVYELTEAMNNIIIPKYETTTNVVNKLFNQDFANEINDCLTAINNQQ